MTYVQSHIDNSYYLVRNVPDKQEACNTLARLRQNAIKLSDYLYNNINDDSIKNHKQYVTRLHERIRDIIILESTQDSIYTSYSVNKGEQIVFCLRSRKIYNKLHDINLMMYVVLHEISHVACPVYDNHGPLFKEIFKFITENAIKIGIYQKIDFAQNPEDYCGLNINDSIV
jgi:predicted metal-dependent hydrolase